MNFWQKLRKLLKIKRGCVIARHCEHAPLSLSYVVDRACHVRMLDITCRMMSDIDSSRVRINEQLSDIACVSQYSPVAVVGGSLINELEEVMRSRRFIVINAKVTPFQEIIRRLRKATRRAGFLIRNADCVFNKPSPSTIKSHMRQLIAYTQIKPYVQMVLCLSNSSVVSLLPSHPQPVYVVGSTSQCDSTKHLPNAFRKGSSKLAALIAALMSEKPAKTARNVHSLLPQVQTKFPKVDGQKLKVFYENYMYGNAYPPSHEWINTEQEDIQALFDGMAQDKQSRALILHGPSGTGKTYWVAMSADRNECDYYKVGKAADIDQVLMERSERSEKSSQRKAVVLVDVAQKDKPLLSKVLDMFEINPDGILLVVEIRHPKHIASEVLHDLVKKGAVISRFEMELPSARQTPSGIRDDLLAQLCGKYNVPLTLVICLQQQVDRLIEKTPSTLRRIFEAEMANGATFDGLSGHDRAQMFAMVENVLKEHDCETGASLYHQMCSRTGAIDEQDALVIFQRKIQTAQSQ